MTECIKCPETHIQRFNNDFQDLTYAYLLPLHHSNTCPSADDQTLVIAKMPLTSLGLHVFHQTILLCLLPGLPMLHASHKVCVQDELLAGDAKAYC